MKIIKILFLFTLTIILLPSCSLINKKYKKSFTYEYSVDVSNKSTIIFDNLDGNFKIYQTEDSVVKMNYKTSILLKKNELGKEIIPLKLKIDTLDSKLVVKIVERISEFDFLKIGKDFKDEFEIYIPENLQIEINSDISNILIDKLTNDFQINLNNGDITIKKPKGNYNVTIVNGKLVVDADSLKNLTANITNGRFYLINSKIYSGNLNLNVENGKISTKGIDFDNIIKSDKKTLIATKGSSENKLNVNIVNGRIYLKENVKQKEDKEK
ncbi:MAG: hypothetical protein N2490_09455 [Ignavibacteria bacterium]|nr:hypothetical protein [Ignavibacteria bacterium]